VSKGKKFNSHELVSRIEKITRDRIAKDKVVSLKDMRELQKIKTAHTLLIIEDDETMRSALRRIFEGEGYQVLTAADGTQLSLVLDDKPIDLIILDIGLPWINGFEIAELMKANEGLKDIPLIFVSGRSSDVDVKKGFEVGADDFIKKPFDAEKIKKTVSTLIELART
jgi:two-component system aerobic respiration control protein ArcA